MFVIAKNVSGTALGTTRRCLHSSARSSAAAENSSNAAQRSQAGPSRFFAGNRTGSSRGEGHVRTPPSPNRIMGARGPRGAPLSRESDQLNKSMLNTRMVGKYYSPSFLNLEEHADTRKAPRKYPTLGPSAAVAKKIDPLYRLGLHPGHPSLHDDSYKNPALLSQYVSEMGKIQGRKTTELTRRSQREVGKAIRRARSMGLMPVMSKNVSAWRKPGSGR